MMEPGLGYSVMPQASWPSCHVEGSAISINEGNLEISVR